MSEKSERTEITAAVSLSDRRLSYSGRIDWENKERPELIFPASSLTFRFFGRKAVLAVENKRACWENDLGAWVDKEQKRWRLNHEGVTTIVLVEEDEDREHEILLFKRQDSCHTVTLCSLTLSQNAKLLEPPEKPRRRIEVYGDSVSAGEVSEAVDYVGKSDPIHQGEYSNSWYSYAWIAARMLNAELHDIAQGGIPLLNGTGWVAPPVYPGMEFMWDKVHYHPQLGRVTNWNFSLYRPHLVIVAIGQNDSNPADIMKEDRKGKKAEAWKRTYKELIMQIRKNYPKAVILLATTILEHHRNWDLAIDEVYRDLQKNDARLFHFFYSRNGCGTPGHVRIPEAEEMAGELVSFINQLDVPIWEDEQIDRR